MILITFMILNIVILLSLDVLADTQIGLNAGSGWVYLPDMNHTHMGTKSFQYNIQNPYGVNRPNGYNFDSNELGYISSGINMWGSNLSLSSTTSSSAKCTIKRQFLTVAVPGFIRYQNHTSGSVPLNSHIFDNETNHVTSSVIILCTTNWPYNSDKAPIVVAHELGHVVGLGHVSDNTQIMHSDMNDSLTVTSNDIKGVKAMTHGCTNNNNKPHSTYTFMSSVLCYVNCNVCGINGYADHFVPNPTYTSLSATKHQLGQCSQCSSYIYEDHVFFNGYCMDCGRQQ